LDKDSKQFAVFMTRGKVMVDAGEREMMLRGYEREADILPIMDLIRGDSEDLFGHHSYQAFLATPPTCSFLGFIGGVLVGVVIGSVRGPPRKKDRDPAKDESPVKLPDSMLPIRTGYVALTNVKVEFRRKGIGAELMDSDLESLNFYESRNFYRVKKVPRYYSTREGSFWMESNVTADLMDDRQCLEDIFKRLGLVEPGGR
jgi:ribosomal protein S18 acetylase RimI-like enzyme